MFNLDNPFWNAVGKICDLIILNLLFLVCSIPIFTAGVSAAAMYTVVRKIGKNEGGGVVKEFFGAWKSHFKQAVILWIILLPVGLLTLFEMYLLSRMEIPELQILKYVFVTLFTVWLILVSYVFPVQSRFGYSAKKTLKISFLMGFYYLIPWTVLLLFFNLLPLIFLLMMPQFSMAVGEVMCVIGFAAVAGVNSFILERVFLRM